MYKIVNRRKRWATRLADALGRALFLPRTLGRRPEALDPEEVRRILVIRTAYVGDVVMTLPMLKPLRDRFPSARLTFLTAPAAAPLLLGHPYIDETLTFAPPWFYPRGDDGYRRLLRRLRQQRFDLVVEARADIREILAFVAPLRARYKVSYDIGGGGYLLTHTVPYPGLRHKVEYHLDMARYLGAPVNGLEWALRLGRDEQDDVDRILSGIGVRGPFVAVHPGSRLDLKRWPEERFAAAGDRIGGETAFPVVLLGNAAETPVVARVAEAMRAPCVSLAGRLTLRQLAGVLSRAALLLGNDSAPLHLAAAMGTPVVAVFGPSKSRETGPYGVPGRAVERDVPCRAGCDESRCRARDRWACMLGVAVDDVVRALRDTVRSSATSPPSGS